jgi:hypothetical protein
MQRSTHRIQQIKRAVFARVIASFAIAIGSCTTISIVNACDKCGSQATNRGPTCGCETSPNIACDAPKASCKTCGPSFAEKFLKKLDQAGDRFEASQRQKKAGLCDPCFAHTDQLPRFFHANSTSNNSGPSCGFEPSCGCESTNVISTVPSSTLPYPALVPVHPIPGSLGSVGDQHSSPARVMPMPVPSPFKEAPQSQRMMEPTRDSGLPRILEPDSSTMTPPLRQPFESRPSTPSRRLPADEAPPVPKGLVPSPFKSFAPESLPPDSNPFGATDLLPSRTPAIVPAPNVEPVVPDFEQSLPDVLVDPFKDDVSARNQGAVHSAIQLSSTRRTPQPSLLLRSPAKKNERSSPPLIGAPERLTTEQSDGRDAIFAANDGQVVPSAYYSAVPVKVSARSIPSPATSESLPTVSRIAVPRR